MSLFLTSAPESRSYVSLSELLIIMPAKLAPILLPPTRLIDFVLGRKEKKGSKECFCSVPP